METATVPLLGFIIPSYVATYEHLNLLLLGVSKIRKYYQSNKIVIIDDNSPLPIKNIPDIINDINIHVELAEYKCGEMNPYFYYYKNKYFTRAVIIQDSFHLKRSLPAVYSIDINFIWFFRHHHNWRSIRAPLTEYNTKNNIINHDDEILDLINIGLPDNEFKKLFKTLYFDKNAWNGCFGCMSIISHNFLVELQTMTSVLDIIPYIRHRRDRMAMESIFAVACFYTKKISIAHNNYFYDAEYTHLNSVENGSHFFSTELFVKYSLCR